MQQFLFEMALAIYAEAAYRLNSMGETRAQYWHACTDELGDGMREFLASGEAYEMEFAQ